MSDPPKGPAKLDLEAILGPSGGAAGEADEILLLDGEADGAASPPAAPAAAGPVAAEEPDAEQRILRLRADFENYRRRKQQEMEELRGRAAENLVAELLPVLDSLERALQGAAAAEADPFRGGVELIRRQILDVLAGAGLQPIQTAGEPFDPRVHEAVVRQVSDGLPPDMVVEELQRGYKFGGRLLRPALVKVTCRDDPAAPEGDPSGQPADGSAAT